MKAVATVAEIFAAIQAAKGASSAYCTNFFPVEAKLKGWVERNELFAAKSDGAVLFFKEDRDFWHLYFGAADVEALRQAVTAAPVTKSEKVTVDLVGREGSLAELMGVFEAAGFRRYNNLCRLARMAGANGQEAAPSDARVMLAEQGDCGGILDLLGRSFDKYAEQLPELPELRAAVENGQIFLVRHEGKPAAMLYFEAQGLTSYVRYWLVDAPFRAAGYGSALMRHYFAHQPAAKRFILWVLANNENAIQKYRHYGYAPDGLVDHVLANNLIPS